MSTPDWLDELERLHQKATPGPWRRYQTGIGVVVCAVAPGKAHTLYADPPGGTFPSADLALIRESRNALPRLLAIARAARAAAREWKNVNASDADWHNTMRVLCEALGASEVDADG